MATTPGCASSAWVHPAHWKSGLRLCQRRPRDQQLNDAPSRSVQMQLGVTRTILRLGPAVPKLMCFGDELRCWPWVEEGPIRLRFQIVDAIVAAINLAQFQVSAVRTMADPP